jgi:hypothetical protein
LLVAQLVNVWELVLGSNQSVWNTWSKRCPSWWTVVEANFGNQIVHRKYSIMVGVIDDLNGGNVQRSQYWGRRLFHPNRQQGTSPHFTGDKLA